MRKWLVIFALLGSVVTVQATSRAAGRPKVHQDSLVAYLAGVEYLRNAGFDPLLQSVRYKTLVAVTGIDVSRAAAYLNTLRDRPGELQSLYERVIALIENPTPTAKNSDSSSASGKDTVTNPLPGRTKSRS